MDKNLMKKTSIFCCILLMMVLSVISIFGKTPSKNQTNMSGVEMLNFYTRQAKEEQEEIVEGKVRIKMPEGIGRGDIRINNDYVNQTVTIHVPETSEKFYYNYPLVGSSDYIQDLSYGFKDGKASIKIILDSVYEHIIEFRDDYLYLSFVEPKSLYDKIVVIDAGHGGTEPGKPAGDILEKNINLDIVLKLKKMLDNTDIRVYYTRLKDENPSFFHRVNLANATKANMFISIHNNSNESYIHGTQVLWNEKKKYKGLGTFELSQILLDEAVKSMGSKDMGLIDGNEAAYIVRTAEVPASIIEVGFMTNDAELANLLTDEYQQKAAQGIYNGILRAFEEGF
ncbi:N-acetylmuramoyl-L-alanine amidase family protein [Anaerosacchariphilus polymeriproducens]|uniref:N-acetylmuramoyl-L-alanine amidase n=1 Tax=Anaerosacchariphilus polymeriproducens TaxID=1812858 RepID=A0A371AYZ9_9FIRM|nr:N-acetylmuramoyl-L-alanine amidase [Anaerosacchariphilus polymeriproducens]RDU24769.1 N-acetylmuramoyl-L-alanine amidase [Anaerosacchariphilus polymeriproducens]